MQVAGENASTTQMKPRICDECIVQYTFSNPVSESFEANICFLADSADKKISNEDAIPRGAYFCNESELIGVVLYSLEEKRSADLKHILGSRNGIATLLQRHLIGIIGFSVVCALTFLAINAIISAYLGGYIG